jgi:hypothetical protein
MTMKQDCQGFLSNRERRISRGGFRRSHTFLAVSKCHANSDFFLIAMMARFGKSWHGRPPVILTRFSSQSVTRSAGHEVCTVRGSGWV